MKKIITLALAFIPMAVWAQQGKFILKINVGSAGPASKVYINFIRDGKKITDSASTDKGMFQLSGPIGDPTMAQLIMDHKGVGLSKLSTGADIKTIWLEEGNIFLTAKDSLRNTVITGSKMNEDYAEYTALTAADDQILIELYKTYKAAPEDKRNNKDFASDIQTRYDKANADEKKLWLQFAQQHPGSYVSLEALTMAGGKDIDIEAVEPLYKNLSAKVRNTVAGKALGKSMEIAHTTSIGAEAPVFTQNDVNDKAVHLTDFKGKYVLLDFWASWCAPCRAENPNVVKAWHKYKDRNFTVLGVSLDRPGNKSQWEAAIKADNLQWTQVSDLKFWKNEAVVLYGIKSIPQNYLIDPNGKIIAKNLRGEELDKKLAELFN